MTVRSATTRQRILDAAERLMREGRADFSMRDLAAAAGVSFATPFNQFGSKSAIMHALSARRIDTMAERFAAASPGLAAAGRVTCAIEIAAAVMVAEPQVNRAVMWWIGTPAPIAGEALARSTALWAMALDGAEDMAGADAKARADLSGRLAIAFRGALSFWTAGELSDEALVPTALDIALTLLAAMRPGIATTSPPSFDPHR